MRGASVIASAGAKSHQSVQSVPVPQKLDPWLTSDPWKSSTTAVSSGGPDKLVQLESRLAHNVQTTAKKLREALVSRGVLQAGARMRGFLVHREANWFMTQALVEACLADGTALLGRSLTLRRPSSRILEPRWSICVAAWVCPLSDLCLVSLLGGMSATVQHT